MRGEVWPSKTSNVFTITTIEIQHRQPKKKQER